MIELAARSASDRKGQGDRFGPVYIDLHNGNRDAGLLDLLQQRWPRCRGVSISEDKNLLLASFDLHQLIKRHLQGGLKIW